MTRSDSVEIQESLVYCQRIFAIGSVLPQQKNPMLFKIAVLYYIIIGTMEFLDFLDNLHNFHALLVLMMEWPITISVLLSIILIRMNHKLIAVVEKIQREAKGSMFKSDEEKRLYRRYNIISVYFDKYVSIFAVLVAYMMYVRPGIHLLLHLPTHKENNTQPFILPFRANMFFDYHNNAKLYVFMYLYQFPIPFLAVLHAAQASLVVTSTLHVCGRFSILSWRIRMSLTESEAYFHQRMKILVSEHLELLEFSDCINNCFQNILLVDYMNCTFRLGIALYMLLITLEKGIVAFVNLFMYTIIVASWLYLYSYIGERLLNESQKIGDAFYDTDWINIESRNRRCLVICVVNGQIAQNLKGGKFYKFTLFGFTDIVKSSMAFFSVLRTNVE